MQDGSTIAGHRLTGRTRASEIGTWNDAVSPAGTPSGVLRFDARLLAEPAARTRLVTVVTADRRLQQTGLTGLLPIADLVTARGDIWLIAGRRAMPTVANLLTEGGHRPDAGSAGTIMVETAQALVGLHAGGLAHGALHPGTVVIGDDGSALLAERGLLEALRGEPASRERDIAAWAALARGLAASWADGHAADLFERAAATASLHGLGAARDTLLAGRDVLPSGFTTRERLIETLHWWAVAEVPTSPAPPTPDTGEIITLLAPQKQESSRQESSRQESPGQTSVRFGPGVPSDTTAAQVWRSGRNQLETLRVQEAAGGGGSRRRRRRKSAWAGTLLFAITLAAVILWLRQTPDAAVAVREVNVQAPKKALSCDGTANIIGRITTNGGAGSIRYIWLRSDGQKLPEQEQRVISGAKSVELPLHWKVTGSGSFKGTATLRVLSPTTTGKPVQDKASFSYKC